VVRAFDPCISCSAHLARVENAPPDSWETKLEDIQSQGTPFFVGIGNPDRSDDALGILIAEKLREKGVENVWLETELRKEDQPFGDSGKNPVVFLDAIDMQAEPGKITLIPFEYMFRQVSLSHKLAPFTKVFKNDEQLKNTYILGIQPESLMEGREMTECVQNAMSKILMRLLNGKQ